jgi:hypothetical protein
MRDSGTPSSATILLRNAVEPAARDIVVGLTLAQDSSVGIVFMGKGVPSGRSVLAANVWGEAHNTCAERDDGVHALNLLHVGLMVDFQLNSRQRSL